jgi:site-specific recombinase XerD
MKYIVNNQIVLSQPLEGPLATHIASFTQWVKDQGYSRYSVYRRVLLAACFSRWLGQKSVGLESISTKDSTGYLKKRAQRVRLCHGDPVALKQLMVFLRSRGIVPPEKTLSPQLTPIDKCLQAYERYLREERALAGTTIINYVPFIRRFLEDRFSKGRITLSDLRAGDVVKFVQGQVKRLHLKRAKVLTTALRSFLQYARYCGDITLDLAAAVPIVANWSMPSIPRAIPVDQVRKLLASINRRTAMGRRDYAILLLLARLGLRASEVTFLELDDIDWRTGRVSVRGKSSRQLELPLPADVGGAIVAYLQNGRSHSISRRVFLRSKAPIRGFLDQRAIGSIVRYRLKRAGINAPTKGAHQFRHGLATQMLRHGASLTEIGELLGHRSPETTKIYAKVDLDALRTLALPWPGGVR